ncbi:MAG: hypothetical protein ACFFF9_00500 [Candidatus Thorarchaeota archaeon]
MGNKLQLEPEATPSVLSNIPNTLQSFLMNSIRKKTRERKTVLVASNSLANRFILEQWGIRASQRRRYKNLFASVRQRCRAMFHNYLARGKTEWVSESNRIIFGVYKFDEIRGNLILAFVKVTSETEWSLPR